MSYQINAKWLGVRLITAILLFLTIAITASIGVKARDNEEHIYYNENAVYINNDRITGYEINGKTAIRCEDLPPYGFDIMWDSREWTFRISDRRLYKDYSFSDAFAPSTYITMQEAGGEFMFWNDTGYEHIFYPYADLNEPEIRHGEAGLLIDCDIRIVLNGIDIPAYFTENGAFILCEDMVDYGYSLEPGEDKEVHISRHKQFAFNSDIGTVDVDGLFTSHMMISMFPYAYGSFVPTIDGEPLKTSNPHGILPQTLTAENSAYYVPLTATVEALGLKWTWDYTSQTFGIYEGDISYETMDWEEDFSYEAVDVFAVEMNIKRIDGGYAVADVKMSGDAYLYGGVVYVNLRDIAAAVGLDADTTGFYTRGYTDTGIGEISYTEPNVELNAENIIELRSYDIAIDDPTFGVYPFQGIGTDMLRVTDKKTGYDTLYFPMSAGKSGLLPPFTFSNVRTFMTTRSNTVRSNIFAFDISAFKPSDEVISGYEANGTFQYANRNTTLTVKPFSGTSVRVENVRTAPVVFTIDGEFLYFNYPGDSSGVTNFIRTTGLFYDGCLYVPLDFIASAFGYVIEIESNQESVLYDPYARAVVVFSSEDGLTSAELSHEDMNKILSNMAMLPLRQDVLPLRPEEFNRYINFYTESGENCTVWFNYGNPYFLDAAYGDNYIWRQWYYYPSNGNGSKAAATWDTNSIIESYMPQSVPTAEVFNAAKDVLILPENECDAEIVRSAAAKNLFPVGYLDSALDKPATRVELQEIIAYTLFSLEHGLVATYEYSKPYTLGRLLSADNMNITDIMGSFWNGDRYYGFFESYEYSELALYIHLALGIDVPEEGSLDANGVVTREEASQTFNAILTLYTGETGLLANEWSNGEPDEPITRLEAVAAVLELYTFCSQYY